MNRERHRDKSTINVFACGIGLVCVTGACYV